MTGSFKKILLIDDDKDYINPLTRYLTMNKFQVNIAFSGEKGLKLNEHINFDLIITDLKMEGMNGLEVIEHVQRNYPDTNIIVVSGFISEDEFKDINNNPFVKAIRQKPVDYDELLELIRQII